MTYTATLTRRGRLSQTTSVSLSLIPDAAQGTAAGPPTTVTFASGETSKTASIAVQVPTTATPGTATYRFVAVYDPTGTDGSPQDTEVGAPTSFIVASDGAAPACAVTGIITTPPKRQQVTVQDAGSGLASLTITMLVNATITVPAYAPGSTSPLVLTATKVDPSQSSRWAFTVTDVAGNTRTCA